MHNWKIRNTFGTFTGEVFLIGRCVVVFQVQFALIGYRRLLSRGSSPRVIFCPTGCIIGRHMEGNTRKYWNVYTVLRLRYQQHCYRLELYGTVNYGGIGYPRKKTGNCSRATGRGRKWRGFRRT